MGLSRRQLLAGAGTAGFLGAAGLPAQSKPARAAAKTLRIMQWRHFVPSYDPWFNDTFVPAWGAANDTEVIVENVGYGELKPRALAEAAAREGHDLVQFVTPVATLSDHLIDHREIFEECRARNGPPLDFATRAHFNPGTKTYLGFAAAYQPALVTYRRDLWGGQVASLARWRDILLAARRIRLVSDKPIGLSLGSEHNGEQTLRSIMYSFGASEQDDAGNPALRSAATLEALAFVKELLAEAMTPAVLGWDGASNNQFMLTGEGTLTVDSLSIARAAEGMPAGISADLALAPMPEGPDGRRGSFGFYTYGIWRFARNEDGAKQFLVDLATASRDAFIASRFQNMPCYPASVPDLPSLVAADTAQPQGKYALMTDVASWTTNVGWPGHTSPPIADSYERGVISRMFAAAVTGRLSLEEARDTAASELETIFATWRGRGKA